MDLPTDRVDEWRSMLEHVHNVRENIDLMECAGWFAEAERMHASTPYEHVRTVCAGFIALRRCLGPMRRASKSAAILEALMNT